MIAVPPEVFQRECDRVSKAIDAVNFERLRWAKVEAPMLNHLVELAFAAIEDRSEFEFAEEGCTTHLKRYILKVHSNRVMAVSIWLEQGHACINAEAISRSPYKVREDAALCEEYSAADAVWMAHALAELFGRIEFQGQE